MNKHERVGPFTIGGCAHNEMVERELRELWTAAGVTPERQDAVLAEITAKAQPGAKVGPFTIGGCAHNEMVPNDSTTHAWKCAQCGYVYGESDQ